MAALAPFKDRIQLLAQKNAGPSAARNAGARVAQFPVLAFLDADDEIHEDFVRSHLAVRSAHPNVELSLNSFEVVRGGKRERTELLRERAGSSANAHAGNSTLLLHDFDARFVVNVHSGGYCIDRALFERSGGFDEGLRCWEITDALTRFSLEAKEVAVLDEVLSRKFEDGGTGQFDDYKNDLDQRRAFCERLMIYIPRIPDESRAPYYREIEALCVKLWRSFAVRDLLAVQRAAAALPGARGQFALPAKVQATIRIARLFVPAETPPKP